MKGERESLRAYIISRLLQLIPVLFIVSILIFMIIHITPGDPAAALLGDNPSKEDIERIREALGLNDPLYVQYFNWLTGVLQGDFGTSLFKYGEVTTTLIEHLKPTIVLTIMALFIALLIGLPLGVMAAKYQGKFMDKFVTGFSLIGVSVPSFLIGLILMMVFAVKFNWLPAGGFKPISAGLGEHLRYLILPAVTLSFVPMSLIIRITKSSVLEVMHENYVKTAFAKGLKENIVIYKHVLKNALITILTVIGQIVIGLMGGAVVTETIYSIPGIGQLVVNSVMSRDYPVIQGALLLIAAMYVLINLVIDLLYALIDPRVRLNSKG